MALLFFSVPAICQDSLIISEFMAVNNDGIQDEDGTYSDWIEIHNGHTDTLNLTGWYLTDDPGNYYKWGFPSVNLMPGEYLVVFASDKDRKLAKDKLHTNFKLSGSGEFLALSKPDSAWYSSVFTPAFPEQYDNISYALKGNGYIYSSIPTPGAPNDSGTFVPTPLFSVPHGLYDASFMLALGSEQAGAEIYYTTDASTPDIGNGTLYTDSILIDSTTVIRAVAVLDGTSVSASVTSSYLFPDNVFHQTEEQTGYPETWLIPHDYLQYDEIATHYGMNPHIMNITDVQENLVTSIRSLPVVSVVTDIDHLFSKDTSANEGGIYIYSGESLGSTSSLLYHLGRGWERPASVEYFNSGEADGMLDFQENCGLKIHGGASRSTRKTLKRSFKIGFKAEYGPTKLKEEVFGEEAPDQYDRLILRGGFDNRLENQVVDPWVKSAMRDMGHYAARSKFVHLFLNGMYWGMYNLSEQMDDNCMRDNLGGKSGDYDIIKDYYEVEAGDTEAWDRMIELAADPDNFQVLIGNHPDGTPDPSSERLLNPENLIDYVINIAYNNPWDWDNHNWFAARKKTGSEGFHFLVWDAESGLSDGNKIEWIMEGGYPNRPSSLFRNLMQNGEFSDLFIARVNRNFFEGGALTPEPGLKRYRQWLDELDTALIADQARWYGDDRDIWNIRHHSWIDNYFPERTEEVFRQFIDLEIYPEIPVPEFSTESEYIPADSVLLLTAPKGAQIRYTLTGTDPGYFSLAAAADIVVYQDSIPKPEEGSTFTVKARTKLGTLWSTVAERTFTVGEDPSLFLDDRGKIAPLLACYPNPFKESADIRITLDAPAHVSLEVYNAMGGHIATLENGHREAGEHLIRWDAGGQAPGIYFCILRDGSGTVQQSVKMLKN